MTVLTWRKALVADNPVIHLYAPCRNEAFLLPYFFKHYDQFVSQYFIWDNCSIDNTRELLKANSKVTSFDNPSPDIRDDIYLQIKNEAWKQFSPDADWIICCDIDEFLYFHDDPFKLLERYEAENITVPRTVGFGMAYEMNPYTEGKQLYDDNRTGLIYMNNLYNKFALFNNRSIESINYDFGCHTARPEGFVRYNKRADILLLHYAFPPEEVIRKRGLERIGRVSEHNRYLQVGNYTQDNIEREVNFRKQIEQRGMNIIAVLTGRSSDKND
jgi:hypothetical protein